MKQENKHILGYIAFGVTLYAVLMNLKTVLGAFSWLGQIFLPVLLGFLLAFILNVPMTGFEKRLGKLQYKGKPLLKEKTLGGLSLLLSFLSVLLVLALAITMLIPELIASGESLVLLVKEKWPELEQMLQQYHIDTAQLADWIQSLNWEDMVKRLFGGAGSIINSAVNVVSALISGLGTAGIALVIAVYALLGKKQLAKGTKDLLQAHLNSSRAGWLIHVGRLISSSYSKFFSGQCLEACILGVLMLVAFTVLGVPYASLIGVLTAVCAFVPYVGAFLSCAIGAFLVLLVAPEKVILYVVVYLVVQFVENQFIYPHVVGGSVGLGPLWTLIAVLVGGSLMGLVGMLFFIPLTAVLVTLLNEYTQKRLQEKGKIPAEEMAENLEETVDK